MNRRRDELPVASTASVYRGKVSSLISCLTLSLGCPERHVVLERT